MTLTRRRFLQNGLAVAVTWSTMKPRQRRYSDDQYGTGRYGK